MIYGWVGSYFLQYKWKKWNGSEEGGATLSSFFEKLCAKLLRRIYIQQSRGRS